MPILTIFFFILAVVLAGLYWKLRSEYLRTSTLYEVGKRINSTVKLNQLLKEIMESTTKVLEAEASSVMLLDRETKQLVFEVALGEKGEAVKEIRLNLGEGIAGWVALHGQSLLIDDVNNDPRFKKEISKNIDFPNKAMLCVPLKYREEIIGVVQVINKKNKKGKFSPADLAMLEAMSSQMSMAIQNARFYNQLEKSYLNTVYSLVKAIEAKDPYTKGHSERVAEISLLLGRQLGLNRDNLQELQMSALLHDMGKIGIKEGVLQKPGPLDPVERAEMEKHTIIGWDILHPIGLTEEIIEGVKFHHERFDGGGYPDKLQGDDIPFFARIIAVADTYDAMYSDRPYRKGLPLELIHQEINSNRNTQFDPCVVDALNQIREIGGDDIIVLANLYWKGFNRITDSSAKGEKQ